jgi:hypothetical protein
MFLMSQDDQFLVICSMLIIILITGTYRGPEPKSGRSDISPIVSQR